jgi:hypothetical protein
MGVKANSGIERAVLTYGYDVLPIGPIRDRGPVSAAFLDCESMISDALRGTYAIYHTGGMPLRVTFSPCLASVKEPAARNMRC